MHETLHVEIVAPAPLPPAGASERMLRVAAMFGITAGAVARPLWSRFDLAIEPGSVIAITGPSGSGKSTLLGVIGRALAAHAPGMAPMRMLLLDEIPLPAGVSMLDAFSGPLEDALRVLSLAGLSEAALLLRAPAELSTGQQFRYRLAQFLASDAEVLLADEFAACLDRTTARVIAWQLGKFIRRSAASPLPRAAILAMSHDDLLPDLAPSVRLHKDLGPALHVFR